MDKLVTRIFELDQYPLSFKNATYGGEAGSKDGIVINGQDWMVKYPKNIRIMQGKGIASYSTAPLSEYIGSHIFEILGIDVHHTILGIRNNKLVVGCKDFAVDKMLLEFRTIKNHTGEALSDLLDSEDFSTSERHVVNLKEVILHLKKNPVLKDIPGIQLRFFTQAVIDILIGNNDRNNGNWGILRQAGKPDTLAPVFDNGASFLSKASDEKVYNILHSPEVMNNSLNVLTAYGNSEHQYSAKTFLKVTQNESAMQQSILKIVPKIKESMPQIEAFLNQIPEVAKHKNGETIPVCSKARRELYLTQMQNRLQYLLLPAYQQTLERVQTKEEYWQKRQNDCLFLQDDGISR